MKPVWRPDSLNSSTVQWEVKPAENHLPGISNVGDDEDISPDLHILPPPAGPRARSERRDIISHTEWGITTLHTSHHTFSLLTVGWAVGSVWSVISDQEFNSQSPNNGHWKVGCTSQKSDRQMMVSSLSALVSDSPYLLSLAPVDIDSSLSQSFLSEKVKNLMLENFAKVPWSVAELQSLVFSRTAFWLELLTGSPLCKTLAAQLHHLAGLVSRLYHHLIIITAKYFCS